MTEKEWIKDYNEALKKASVDDESLRVKDYRLTAKHMSDEGLHHVLECEKDWVDGWTRVVREEISDRVDNILIEEER